MKTKLKPLSREQLARLKKKKTTADVIIIHIPYHELCSFRIE